MGPEARLPWTVDLWMLRLWTAPLSGWAGGQRIRAVSTIFVDPDGLRATAARVDDAATALDRASRQLGRVGTGALGHPRLAHALDDFLDGWEYAVDRIGLAATATAQRLRAAAETYEATDTAVRDAAGGGR
jgi:uncharacterized protein YukE